MMANFQLEKKERDEVFIQLNGSEYVNYCEEDVASEELDLERIEKYQDKNVVAFTGSEDIYSEKEELMEIIQGSIELHLPIGSIIESKDFVRHNRNRLKIVFHLEKSYNEMRSAKIKEEIKKLDRPDQIRFIYHLDSDAKKLLSKQFAAYFPRSRIDTLVREKTKGSVESALRLSEKLLTISRRRKNGIGMNIPQEMRNKDLEKELFVGREKEIVWLKCSQKDKKYVKPK